MGQSDVTLRAAIAKLQATINTTGKIPSLITNLDVEFNTIPFHLSIENHTAIVTFYKWSDGFVFLKRITAFTGQNNITLTDIKQLLATLGITIYLLNGRLAILGPRAGTLLPRLLAVVTSYGQTKSKAS
ncbi:MAG: hypothetical protein ABR512_07155 [Desulfopila sp.]